MEEGEGLPMITFLTNIIISRVSTLSHNSLVSLESAQAYLLPALTDIVEGAINSLRDDMHSIAETVSLIDAKPFTRN